MLAWQKEALSFAQKTGHAHTEYKWDHKDVEKRVKVFTVDEQVLGRFFYLSCIFLSICYVRVFFFFFFHQSSLALPECIMRQF